MLALKFNQI